jgi:hypothetical protein
MKLVKNSAAVTRSQVRIVERGGNTHKQGKEGLMNLHRERLGEEICQVVCASPPLYDELALADTIAYPVESHVDRFAALRFNAIIGDANSAFVVAQEER